MAPLARRSWAPRGQTPRLMQPGRSRRKASVIGALVISPQRRRVRAYFDILPEANFDAASILRFVQAVRRALRTPIRVRSCGTRVPLRCAKHRVGRSKYRVRRGPLGPLVPIAGRKALE